MFLAGFVQVRTMFEPVWVAFRSSTASGIRIKGGCGSPILPQAEKEKEHKKHKKHKIDNRTSSLVLFVLLVFLSFTECSG